MIVDKIKSASLTDLVGGVTACLFITGLSYQYGFYGMHGLNGSWVINLLSAKDILTVNIILLTTYLVALSFLDTVFSNSNLSYKNLAIPSNIFMFMTSLYWLADHNKSGAFFCLIVLIIINSILFIVKLNNIFKVLGFLFLILLVPFLNGVYSFNVNFYKDGIPKVVLIQSKIGEEWFLLNTYNDKAILISKDKKNVKIVEIKDISSVKTDVSNQSQNIK
ncbi:hypothetical protein [Acinetobacter ursingii]|uniref:hypothetical protein n=1 Tax=Acinetobacter ursingii TaxID=108980 RepID=UPI00125004D8|nr:hypothetical protein [Acinetobacter ursingii]